MRGPGRASTIGRMRNSLAVITGAVATALAAAPADAAPRPERFVAYVKAEQTTKWEDAAWNNPVGRCSTSSGSAHGTESTVIRTIPLRVLVVRAAGGFSIAYGPLRNPRSGLTGRGSITSSYVSRTRHTPGACEPGPVTGAERDKDESCEASPMRWIVQLTASGGKVTPIFVENEGLEWPTLGLEDCPVHTPEGATSRMTSVPARLPAAKVLDRDEELVVVTGRRTFNESQDLGHTTRSMRTTVRWTLRMRRAR